MRPFDASSILVTGLVQQLLFLGGHGGLLAVLALQRVLSRPFQLHLLPSRTIAVEPIVLGLNGYLRGIRRLLLLRHLRLIGERVRGLVHALVWLRWLLRRVDDGRGRLFLLLAWAVQVFGRFIMPLLARLPLMLALPTIGLRAEGVALLWHLVLLLDFLSGDFILVRHEVVLTRAAPPRCVSLRRRAIL